MGSNEMHCPECRKSNPVTINDDFWECRVCGLQLEQTEENRNPIWVNHEDPNGSGNNVIRKGEKMTGSKIDLKPNDLKGLSPEAIAQWWRIKKLDDRSIAKMLGTRVRREVRDTIRRTYLDLPQMQTLCIDLFDVGWPEPGTAPDVEPMWLAAHPHGRAASRVAVHLIACEKLGIRIDDKVSFAHEIFLEESNIPPSEAKESWRFTQKAMRMLRKNHRQIRGQDVVSTESLVATRMCLDNAIEVCPQLEKYRMHMLNGMKIWSNMNGRVLSVPKNYLSALAHLMIEKDGLNVNSNLITKVFGGSRQYLKHLDEGRIVVKLIDKPEGISKRD